MIKVNNPFNLDGKTIIVTGASSGIGRECSIRSSQAGARLVLIGRDPERLEETRNLLEGNLNHLVMQYDLTDYKKLDDLLAGKPTPKCIKIDVEGFESAVIAGAQKTLYNQELHVVVLELNSSGTRYGFDHLETHSKMIDQFGFEIYNYNPRIRELNSIDDIKPNSQNMIYIRDISIVINRIITAPIFDIQHTTI